MIVYIPLLLLLSTFVPRCYGANAVDDSTNGTITTTMEEESSGYIIQMDGYECYNNLTYVHERIKNMTYFDQKVFHICPNNIYNLGEIDYETNTCCSNPNDHQPIQLRGNTQYICGKDGDPRNNCTIWGGGTQIGWGGSEFGFEPIYNIFFKGFTFGGYDHYGIFLWLHSIGDVTFEQCTIRDSRGWGVVALYSSGVADLDPTPMMGPPDTDDTTVSTDDDTATATTRSADLRLSSLSSSSSWKNKYPADSMIKLTMNNCSFINNTLPPSEPFIPGLFYAEPPYHHIIVTNSLFYQNSYRNKKMVQEGFAFQIQAGNILELRDNCFYDNEFLTYSVAQSNGTNVTSLENNFAKNNGDIKCPFLYDLINKTCTEPDTSVCSIDGLTPIPSEYTTSTETTTTSTNDDTTGSSSGEVLRPTSGIATTILAVVAAVVLIQL